MLSCQTRVPVEITFKSAGTYADIFNDLELDVEFTGPDGIVLVVPAFWAGSDTFRVRFAAPAPGVYRYTSRCTNASDTGLHGQCGELRATRYPGSCRLYAGGRLEVAETGRTLKQQDGTPFLWLADTWWMGGCSRLSWPEGVSLLASDRVSKGFNAVQIVAGPLPNFEATKDCWHPQQANEAGFPWEENWTRINPAFYDRFDDRVEYLLENELMPCIVGMWGYYILTMGEQNALKHWRNLVARYAAYPVTWCMAGELIMPTYSRMGDPENWKTDGALLTEQWTAVTRYVRQIDPYNNLITAHPNCTEGDSRDMLSDPSLVDFAMLQTGHGGYASLKPTAQVMEKNAARSPRIPVLNGEPCYEGIAGGGWQEIQRYMFWTSILGGAAGHTYGAQPIWAMSSNSEPVVEALNWGAGSWEDAMHYAGSKQVGVGRRLLLRYPWWELVPRHEPAAKDKGRFSAFAAEIPGKLIFYYLPGNLMSSPWLGEPDECMGMVGLTTRLDPEKQWTALFYDPRTGYKVEAACEPPASDGNWTLPNRPSMEDWVLVLETA